VKSGGNFHVSWGLFDLRETGPSGPCHARVHKNGYRPAGAVLPGGFRRESDLSGKRLCSLASVIRNYIRRLEDDASNDPLSSARGE
jgi:hypothetical protein